MALKWLLQWGPEYDLLIEAERKGFSPAALEDEPALPPDLRAILDAFKTVSRARPQSMSGDMLAITTHDILAGWELTGMKAAGLTRQEWFDYAVALDETVIEFYNSRKTRPR